MSKFYKPVPTSLKHRNLQWINLNVAVHDQHCHCEEPLKHIIFGILEQEPTLKFTPEESKEIQKCLTTSDLGDAAGTEDGFGDGDLERLFADDVFGEDDNTG